MLFVTYNKVMIKNWKLLIEMQAWKICAKKNKEFLLRVIEFIIIWQLRIHANKKSILKNLHFNTPIFVFFLFNK